MATDWAADVKKYAAKADDAIIAGIVRYCGIALTKVDAVSAERVAELLGERGVLSERVAQGNGGDLVIEVGKLHDELP